MSDFIASYSTFYDKAEELGQRLKNAKPSSLTQEEVTKNYEISVRTITTFSSLLFGLDGNLKSKAVTYGNGALEMILTISNSTVSNNKKKLIEETLKAIKCSVVRCSEGRNRCRGAGVFSYLKKTFENESDDETIMEQAVTVTAAISMGNDLNALQASVEMESLISRASEIHSNSKQIQNVITYLNALFRTVSMEQDQFKKIHSSPRFFDYICEAQKCEIQADTSMSLAEPDQTEKYQDSETVYSTAIEKLYIANSGNYEKDGAEFSSAMLKDTEKVHSLLKEIIGVLYRKRSSSRYEQRKYDNAIDDARKAISCLEGNAAAVEIAEKVIIQSLVDQKSKDAEKEIAQAKLFVTDVDFLDQMLKKLQME